MVKPEITELTGTVVEQQVGGSSKSAHPAVVLQSDAGDYILRRAGGNPFYDPTLAGLVGRSVRCRGTVVPGQVLMVTEWEDSEGGGEPGGTSSEAP
jgi:hypothetical protein